jgi:hypothetical protein
MIKEPILDVKEMQKRALGIYFDISKNKILAAMVAFRDSIWPG